MKKFFNSIITICGWFWRILSGIGTILSVLFLLVILTAISSLYLQPPTEIVRNSALVLTLQGDLVEKKSVSGPLAKAINEIAGLPMPEEILLQDVLDIINAAAQDSRIKLIVLKPAQLGYAGFNQLQTIGLALKKFKRHHKMIIAAGDGFTQAQYYLASYADEIYLNPMGAVALRGFGLYRIYAKDLLNKLAINFHLFKAGSYKSALEPFSRNNMSAAAKEANNLWLRNLWQAYRQDIAANRGLTPADIDNFINDLTQQLQQAGGNSARMALNEGLVDGLKTDQELEAYLISIVGMSDESLSFRQVSADGYQANLHHSYLPTGSNKDRVGIIVAQGDIVHGEKLPGTISDIDLCRQIRQARNDKTVKALVLRIDSGGGSAFASEAIRQELLRTRRKKPVVVSMGSMAASGGYWIAAAANYIIASPVTLTGSIGIFGAFPTFENSLAKAGIYSDGIGTTGIADANLPFRPPADAIKKAIQLGVEEGYDHFLTIVAESRKLTKSTAPLWAEGRVWDGITARQLGLVDSLGTLEDSVRKAAHLARLQGYEPIYITPEGYPGQKLLQNLLRAVTVNAPESIVVTTGRKVIEHIEHQFDFLRLKDPANLYAHCLIPRSLL